MTHHAMTRTDALVAFLARMLIAWRRPLGALFLLLTLGLGYSALNTRLDPGFNKLIPMSHPYMQAFLQYGSTFSGANRVMVSVRWKGEGDIYNREFLETLNKVTDDVFFINGVSRASVTSLFTANVRYIEITEDGFFGDVVVPKPLAMDYPSLLDMERPRIKAYSRESVIAEKFEAMIALAEASRLSPRIASRAPAGSAPRLASGASSSAITAAMSPLPIAGRAASGTARATAALPRCLVIQTS